MYFLISVLDFLFLSWFFYPVIVILPIICYAIVFKTSEENEFPVEPSFLLIPVIGALLWRFPSLRGLFADWHVYLYVVGGYVLAGFLLSLYKWIMVLVDFRKPNVKIMIGCCRSDIETRYSHNHNAAKDQQVAEQLRRDYQFKNCLVTVNPDRSITIYPDRHKYPIATWWVYWPFFLLSVVFDPLKRVIEKLTEWTKTFYESIARRFSVKG